MSNVVSRKKKFGIPDSLSKGLSNTIKMAENHTVDFKNVVLPLAYIEPDPNNPRRINLSIDEVKKGECDKSGDYEKKQKELESLKELSWSIEKKGLINPITVYQVGDVYRLIAGERRYLASLMANKSDIEARVYKTKPSEKDLILVQWIENTAREDLSLSDKLTNIESIVNHFTDTSKAKKITFDVLMNITGMQRSNAYRYIAILNNSAIKKLIESNVIRSIALADLLVGIKDENLLREAVGLYKSGESVNAIAKFIKSKNKKNTKKSEVKLERRGRVAKNVNLGKVEHTKVVKVLVDALISTPKYNHLQAIFSNTNWDDYKVVTQSFKKLLLELEREV